MLQAKSLFSKSKYVCLLSFLTAILILLIVIFAGNVYPLGDQCILRTDMYHQYAPFFQELRNKLQNGKSLSFTWNLGMGVNFMAIIAYYLASPLNMLVVLVNEDHVIEFMTALIVIKTGLCGASMALYLKSHSPKRGFGAYIFSLFYALSGYTCAYYWNLMWFDAVALFPLVVLGAERLINGKSGLLYGITLALCIFTNYYIAILICIFLIFYFFAYCVIAVPENIKTFISAGMRFALWSILAAGAASVLLLPEIYAFKLTASSDNEFPKAAWDYFSLISELSRHLPLVETEQALDHWPNIYCGTAALLLFLMYIGSKRISLKEKAVYITLSMIFLASFAINVLNFIWHGLHYPNSLPARQSFIYIFLVIFMCFRAYENLKTVSKKELWRCFGISFVCIMLLQTLTDDDAFFFGVFYLALFLTAVYAAIIHLYRTGRLSPTVSGILLFTAVIAELTANTAYTAITTTSRSAFTADNADMRKLADAAGLDADGDFYRIERTKRKSKDDGAWLGYPSASIFSSMANADCTKLYKSLGCEASTNAYSITGSTPLIDMLFGIKYELMGNEAYDSKITTLIDTSGDVKLYRNQYALGPGFVMPKKMSSEWMLELDDPAIVQNSLCDALGTAQALIPVYDGGSSAEGEFAITIDEAGRYFAYEDNPKAGDITVSWSDRKKTFSNLDRSYFMDLGYCEKGELINFSAKESGIDPKITVYRFNDEALEEIYDVLSAQQLKVDSCGDNFIKGTVNADTAKSGYVSDRAEMLFTIPYDEGWTVLVDGKITEIHKGLNAFTAIYISSGEHEIEMHYAPRGLKAGALICLGSIIIIALLGAAGRVFLTKKETEKISEKNF